MKINLFILLITFISLNVTGQDSTIIKGIGINLPSLVGKTIAFAGEINIKKNLTFTIGTGIMINNTLQGTLSKKGEWTSDHNSSGAYVSSGIRLTPRKILNKTYFFFGPKILFGHFIHSGHYESIPTHEWFKDYIIPQDFYFKGDRVYSKGQFLAFAIETGVNFKISRKIHLEFGIQGGTQLWTSKQILSSSSIFAGLGSLNIVGIITPKLIL